MNEAEAEQHWRDWNGNAVERIAGPLNVSLVEPWPHGRLQAQLDRIEAKLDALLANRTDQS